MRSKEFLRLTINPFSRIAGWEALGAGLIFIALMGYIGARANVSFDGALDMHLTKQLSLSNSFLFLAIDIVSVTLTMGIAGLSVSKGFRFIDLLGTMTLAKAPLLILSIAGLFTTTPNLSDIMQNPTGIFSSASFIVVVILSIPVMIWQIILMYNAFKVSCGIKGTQLTVVFITALLVAEVISKICIHYLS